MFIDVLITQNNLSLNEWLCGKLTKAKAMTAALYEILKIKYLTISERLSSPPTRWFQNF